MEVSDPLPYVSINEDDKTADARMRTADPNGRIRNYELDKDKNAAWQLRLKEDGTTVLKVYFEQTYRVTFHDNGKIYDWTAGEAFSDQTRSDYRYNEMTDDFDDYNVTPLKENYSFIGWSKKEEKTTEVLSSRDIASIPVRENADYWAQWKNTGTSSPARPSTDQRNPVPDTSVS